MYPEEYDQPPEQPNFFESPEAIARHIFQIIKSKAGVVTEDSARANLNKVEMRSVRATGDLISELTYAEEVCHWDLTHAKDYFKEKLATTNVPSRSKHGYGIWMAKTDRHVTQPEAEQVQTDINSEFNDEESESTEEHLEKKAGFFGGFFKKKEM